MRSPPNPHSQDDCTPNYAEQLRRLIVSWQSISPSSLAMRGLLLPIEVSASSVGQCLNLLTTGLILIKKEINLNLAQL